MLEIELRNLSLGFGDRTLFSDARLSIYTGDKIGLIGANGCGKTTLLRALLKSADAGGQAMEKYCRMLHRDLAARLRTHNPLPGRLLPYLCRTAEERTGNP